MTFQQDDDTPIELDTIEEIAVSAHKASSKYSNQDQITLPIIPLRNMVINDNVTIAIFVGRKQSIKIIQENEHKNLFFILQKDSTIDKPTFDELYQVGTVAKILQLVSMPDNTVKILVEGQAKGILTDMKYSHGQMIGSITITQDDHDLDYQISPALKSVQTAFIEYSKLRKQYSSELIEMLKTIQEPFVLLDMICMHTDISCEKKQQYLEADKLSVKLNLLLEYIEYEIENIKLSNQITNDVKKTFEAQHRRVLLNAKLEATRKALEDIGDGDTGEEELDSYKQKLKNIPLSAEAKDKAEKEMRKLKSMSSISAEASVIRNYLDWLFGLPWGKARNVDYNLQHATEVMEKNHYGLRKIKERIYEMLAVQSRIGVGKAPILCLYGPPGVGKTSLAKSIADATGREFIRISLGGLHDESEIRGHRSTYIGAKPGKIIQGLKRAETNNPVFLLDEIGEIGQDPRGNPAAALLELLDEGQRHDFRDNFMEIGWDFSQTMFIASTNRLDNLPPALIDRMEIIKLSGYTEDEKINIAMQHLIPLQKKSNGVQDNELNIPTSLISKIVEQYTKEAGVRQLEREIAKICRKSVKQFVDNPNIHEVQLTESNLSDYLGVPHFVNDTHDLDNKVGVTAGLAWTQAGGEILYIEAITTAGTGKIHLTGKLGDVMKESVQAAISFIKSRADQYDLDPTILDKTDIHLHIPEGAIPKDGPSAGIAICTSILSSLTGKCVRGDLAMTGELSLRNKVLPIGGLKEKLLAAMRYNIHTVFIPAGNAKDLEELKTEIPLNKLNIEMMTNVDVVLKNALV